MKKFINALHPDITLIESFGYWKGADSDICLGNNYYGRKLKKRQNEEVMLLPLSKINSIIFYENGEVSLTINNSSMVLNIQVFEHHTGINPFDYIKL